MDRATAHSAPQRTFEVVRVEMRDEQRLDRTKRDAELKQSNREAPSGIKH
jgi:hypothetical protein